MWSPALQLWFIVTALLSSSAALKWNDLEYGVDLPDTKPGPPPDYMVDNTRNQYGVAPDKGSLYGPVLDHTFRVPKQGPRVAGVLSGLESITNRSHSGSLVGRADSSYWLAGQTHGSMPFADNSSYVFYRDVTAYGATGDGVTDDTAAINRAIVDGNRCGLTSNCSSTSTLGALVFFPPGTYRITTPIIQYYYTQFVGDPTNRPVIKGDGNFTGIALIDTDPYIPGGNGNEWYINQNQFFRQIRNFVFDLTEMPNNITQDGQQYVPTGLHWQVAQATSLQNLDFVMPLGGGTQAVGIFMENGSGGFLSDITFYGGNIGFRAGSQQYTHRGLTFQSCVVAISMIWDWGMTWQDLTVLATWTALDTTSYKGNNGQGTGSIAVIDSYFFHVPYAITMALDMVSANILIDNLYTTACESIVLNSGSNTLLAGDASGDVYIEQWGLGNQYTSLNGTGIFQWGNISPLVNKSQSLLNATGSYFTRSKPQYESGFTIVNALDQGIVGDGSTDQTASINSLLAANVGSVVFFPAGVYIVTDTIHVPVGSRLVGEGWSQIMGTGSNFEDEANPHVMVQVGQPGDSGVLEISDMLFTVKGATAGAVLMEWNVHESTQGSAGMWDAHFRVGGATGSDLTLADCPAGGFNTNCMAASLMLHLTHNSSAYLENVWAWVADHDMDAALPQGANTTTATQVSVYGGRGILIESQGPTWLYGTSSEHSVLYQYQLAGANDVYLGHMQTETPYFQPSPSAAQPFNTSTVFALDPTFDECITNSSCVEAWALRILNSTNVYVYSAGFYSFFTNYDQAACLPGEDCQENLIDIGYSQGLWLYNIFTIGAINAVTPEGGILPVAQSNVQSGFTTEINVYLPFALTGANIGGWDDTNNDSNTPSTVYIVPLPCTTVAPGSTFTMSAACTAGIQGLPTSGPNASINNDPPGTPETCHEICDFWRLISGTCCGYGGSLGNPVVIPANVTIPYDIPLPSGFVPPGNITYPSPGGYDPNVVWGPAPWPTTTTTTTTPAPVNPSSSSTSSGGGVVVISTTTTGGSATGTDSGSKPTGTNGSNSCVQGDCGCYPDGTPLETLAAGIELLDRVVLPGGWCHNINGGITVPPAPLPEDPQCTDPNNCRPCQEGVCTDTDQSDDSSDDSCDPDVSTQVGRCDNGNFPLYLQQEQTITCDYTDAEAAEFLGECQMDADANPDYTIALIECNDQACSARAGKKRSLESRQTPAQPQPAQCPPTNSQSRSEPGPGDTGCDVTFNCNTDWWPNVCNNVRSAIEERGKPSILTYQGPGARLDYVTGQWWGTHYKHGSTKESDAQSVAQRDAGTLPGQPNVGWGLVGCEVEEYPWGNSLAPITGNDRYIWSNRAVLRLIPWDENGNHGSAMGAFFQKAYAQGFGDQNNKGAGLTYCVQVTGSNQPADYLLGADQSYNRCGQAYGPAYLLMNGVSAKVRNIMAGMNLSPADSRIWDPWFDENNQLFAHTYYSSAGVVKTTSIPSQYGRYPSPGMKTYLNRNGNLPAGGGTWSTMGPNGVAVGQAQARKAPNAKGSNLIWDDVNPNWANAFTKRDSIESQLDDQANSTRPEPDKDDELEIALALNRTVLVRATNDEILGQVSSRGRRLTTRQISGGSFLDVNVYTSVLTCPVLWEDPCIVEDCWEESGSYWADLDNGNATSSGTSATTTPAPTGPLCYPDTDPDNGQNSYWCECNNYPSTLPTLANSEDICGYTTLPPITTPPPPTTTNPYPYTWTDTAGDIIACATSAAIAVDNSAVYYCSGARSTVYTAPTPTQTTPPAPTYTFGIWSVWSYTDECVDAHCRAVLEGISAYAMTADRSSTCNAQGSEVQDADTLLYPGGLVDHMVFQDGICGGPAPYYCNVTSSGNSWNCFDANGDNTAQCNQIPTQDEETYACHTGGVFSMSDDMLYRAAVCTGPFNCDVSPYV